MADQLLFGIQTNGIKHTHTDPMPPVLERFRMVKEAGIFDYVDKTPDPDQIADFEQGREQYGLPVLAGGWFYQLGNADDMALFERNLAVAQRMGSTVHNTQIKLLHAGGHVVTNEEVAETYLRWSSLFVLINDRMD